MLHDTMKAPDSSKKDWQSQQSRGPFETLTIRNIWKDQPDCFLKLQRGALVPWDIYKNVKVAPESSSHVFPQDTHLRLSVGKKIGRGRTGTVHEVTILDESGSPVEPSSLNILPLVVKIASVNRNVELSREAWFYEQVKSLQGIAIPRCYGFFQIILQWDQVNNIAPWQKPIFSPSPHPKVYLPAKPILEPNPAEALHKPEYMWDDKDYDSRWYEPPLEQGKAVTDVCSEVVLEVKPGMATDPMDMEDGSECASSTGGGWMIRSPSDNYKSPDGNGWMWSIHPPRSDSYNEGEDGSGRESSTGGGCMNPSPSDNYKSPDGSGPIHPPRSDNYNEVEDGSERASSTGVEWMDPSRSDSYQSPHGSGWMNPPRSHNYNEVEIDHLDYQPWSNELPSESAPIQNPNELTDLPQETSEFQFQDSGIPSQFDQPSSEQTHSPQGFDCTMTSKMDLNEGGAWHIPDEECAPCNSRDISQETSDYPSFVRQWHSLRTPDPWRKPRRSSDPINIRERAKPDVKERSPVSSSALLRRRAFEERELGHRPKDVYTTSVKDMFVEGASVLPGLEEHFSNREDYDSLEEEDHWKFIEEADASGNARYHYEHRLLTKEEREQGRTVRTGRWRRPKVLSILVLEKLGDRLPLDKPANLRIIKRDIWDIFDDLWSLKLEHHDIAHRNILKAVSPGSVCPNHGIVHEWRAIDLGFCQIHKKGSKLCKHFIDVDLRAFLAALAAGEKPE